MNKVILVAHGKLAQEMKNSAEMIFGELKDFQTVEFLNGDGLQTLQEKIEQTMTDTADYLILCDLFCGTPYNASCALALGQPERKIEIVSGMSLPLVLEAASMLETSQLADIVSHLTTIPSQTVQAFSQQVIEDEEDF